MNFIFTLVKQISRSNYFSEESFLNRIKDVLNDHYENYPFQHFWYKKLFIEKELLEIELFDKPNIWENHAELNFDIFDYKTADELMKLIETTLLIIKNDPEYKDMNILIKLNTYILG
jgi:hypothetical protein